MSRLGWLLLGVIAMTAVTGTITFWMTDDAGSRTAAPRNGNSETTGASPAPRIHAGATPPRGRAGDVLFRGSVLDPERRPVGEAAVVIRRHGGREFRTRTAHDGTYALAVGPRPADGYEALSLHAVHARGSAVRSLGLSARRPSPIEVRPIVLGPRHAATVRVTYRGQAVAGASVRAMLKPSGDRLRLGAATTGDHGRCSFDDLPAGTLQFIATTDRTGRGLTSVELPRKNPDEIEVQLTEPRPLRIRVLSGDEGEPVEGVTFQVMDGAGFIREPYVPPFEIAPTDADGWTQVGGIGLDGHFTVRAWRDDYPPTARAHPPKGATEWIIRLPATRTLSWVVKPGLAPIPPHGTRLRLQHSDGMTYSWFPRKGYMEKDVLYVPHCPLGYVAVYAIAPGGSIARLDYDLDADGGVETSFRPARTVRVRLRDAGGNPLAARRLDLNTEGASLNTPPQWTDAEGRALWQNVYAGKSEIELEGLVVGTVDLAREDGDFDIVLPQHRDVVIALTFGGRTVMPDRFEFSIDRETRQGYTLDRERNHLRYRLYPRQGAKELDFYLATKGFHTHWGQLSLAGEGPIHLAIDLAPKSVLSALVLPVRKGRWEQWFHIQVQRWDDAKEAWAYAGGGQIGHWNVDEEGAIHAADLEAGRHRFVHTKSGITTPVVTLAAGEKKRTRLDLSDIIEISGRVRVPEGVDYSSVRVVVEGAPVNLSPWEDGKPGESVGYQTGTFSIQVPGSRDLTVTATHPLLTCARPARVNRAQDDIELELVRAPVARIRIDPKPHLSGYWQPPLFVYSHMPIDRWEAEDEMHVHLLPGAPPAQLPPPRRCVWHGKEQILEFRVRPESSSNVYLDLPGLVPKLLPAVAFGPGVTELGDVAFERGSVLRVEANARAGTEFVRIFAEAQSKAATPAYVRRGGEDRSPFALVRGLGSGTFRVHGFVITRKGEEQSSHDFERTVTVDGVRPVTVTVDVR